MVISPALSAIAATMPTYENMIPAVTSCGHGSSARPVVITQLESAPPILKSISSVIRPAIYQDMMHSVLMMLSYVNMMQMETRSGYVDSAQPNPIRRMRLIAIARPSTSWVTPAVLCPGQTREVSIFMYASITPMATCPGPSRSVRALQTGAMEYPAIPQAYTW